MNYIYDGSFEGFLCCVYLHYHREKADGIFAGDGYQFDLTRTGLSVETDEGQAESVLRAISDKISTWDLERVYRVFRTETPEKEMALLNYLRLGFKRGPRIRLLHSHPIVMPVEKADQRFGAEVHRLCGLLRFSVMSTDFEERAAEARPEAGNNAPAAPGNEILYGVIEPDHDVLEFLAPHFTDRFKWDPFIIHDRKRNKALASYGGQWYITEFSGSEGLRKTSSEEEYRNLWRSYFGTIAIKERTNPRCQKSFMPMRYWKHLTELNTLEGGLLAASRRRDSS